jgi:hypothetical protein
MKIPGNIKLISAPWARWVIYALVLAALLYHFGPRFMYGGATNGFDLSNSLVPADQIHHGGPSRDGIPAIDRPRFVRASHADFLSDQDRVLGISRNGNQKAYPIKILNYHEIVNDTFDDEAIVISYCPLCGSGMAFVASIDGTVRDFGVSGLLYNSDVLLYDRETSSLWSQIMMQAVTGPMRGTHLQQIVMSHTTWAAWRGLHPNTQVLSTNTGWRRNYDKSPYSGYADSVDLYFPVSSMDHRYHPKEWVIGVAVGDNHKAYPFAELSQLPGDLEDRVGGQDLRIQFDTENRTGRVFNTRGDELPSTAAYWFAWRAFHPDTEVYTYPD